MTEKWGAASARSRGAGRWIGLIAMVAVLGLGVAGCSADAAAQTQKELEGISSEPRSVDADELPGSGGYDIPVMEMQIVSAIGLQRVSYSTDPAVVDGCRGLLDRPPYTIANPGGTSGYTDESFCIAPRGKAITLEALYDIEGGIRGFYEARLSIKVVQPWIGANRLECDVLVNEPNWGWKVANDWGYFTCEKAWRGAGNGLDPMPKIRLKRG